MRASEFIFEDDDSNKSNIKRPNGIRPRVERSLPATYLIPGLSGQNPYEQYRFGVAMAAAHGEALGNDDGIYPYESESKWGQRQVVVGYGDPNLGKWIDNALRQMGMTEKAKELMSTPDSDEEEDVAAVSPIKPFKGYKK